MTSNSTGFDIYPHLLEASQLIFSTFFLGRGGGVDKLVCGERGQVTTCLYPKDPGVSQERVNPIVGMGVGPSNLHDPGGVWIHRDRSLLKLRFFFKILIPKLVSNPKKKDAQFKRSLYNLAISYQALTSAAWSCDSFREVGPQVSENHFRDGEISPCESSFAKW